MDPETYAAIGGTLDAPMFVVTTWDGTERSGPTEEHDEMRGDAGG